MRRIDIYVSALERELRDRGHSVARELGVWVMYKGQHLATPRLDWLSMASSSLKSNQGRTSRLSPFDSYSIT